MNLDEACRKEGSVERVKELIEQGKDPNLAISFASYYGNTDIVKALLQDGRVDQATCNYALKWACDGGHLDIIQVILQDGRADPRYDDDWAIYVASQDGNDKMIEMLFEDGRVEVTDVAIKRAETKKIREMLLKYKYRVDGPEYCRLKNDLASL